MKKMCLLVIIITSAITFWLYPERQRRESLSDIINNPHHIPSQKEIKMIGPEALFLKGYRLAAFNRELAKNDFEDSAFQSKELGPYGAYNVGNILVEEALTKKDGDILKIAIEYYKEALRQKPDFKAAKNNLELAMKIFKSATIEQREAGVVPNIKLPGFYPRVDGNI